MMFVRVDTFRKMEHAPMPGLDTPDAFLGFTTSTQFFRELPCAESDLFKYNAVKLALGQRMADCDGDSAYMYAGVLPLCVVTEGVTCMNCYREDSRTLYAYDRSRNKLLWKKLEPGNVDLEFWKAMKFDNDQQENKENQE